MRWKDAADEYCNIARALGILGDRWTLLIIREAFAGVRRFDDFRRHLGVARNVLTERLQRLLDAGVLELRAYQTNPPRSEYRLTEKGHDLHNIVISLMTWGDRWLSGPEGPPLCMEHSECGQLTTPVLVCKHCNGPLHSRNTRMVEGPGLPEDVATARKQETERLRAQRDPSRAR